MNGKTTEIIIGINNLVRNEGGFEMNEDKIVRVPIPCDCGGENITKMGKDCEIFSKIVENFPDDMSDLFRQMSEGNWVEAQAIAKRMKLSEDDFIESGGGLLWLAIPIAAGVLLYSRKAY